MTFETSTATPTLPAAGQYLWGMAAGPGKLPLIFNMADFATRSAGGNFGLGMAPIDATSSRAFVQGDVTLLNSGAQTLHYGGYYSSSNWRYATTGNYSGAVRFDAGAGILAFLTSANPGTAGAVSDIATKMALTKDGAVGIGTTTPTTALHVYRAGTTSVESQISNGSVSLISRIDSGSGYVGTNTNHNLGFFTGNVGRWAILHASGAFAPWSDNVFSLGASGTRVSVVYAATGTINTSDERAKVWLGPAPAELTVDQYLSAASRIIDELGFYNWVDGTRWHFGARAQRVVQIFMDEGLEKAQTLDFAAEQHIDAADRPSLRHAFLCFDTWEETREPIFETQQERYRDRVTEMVDTKVLGPDGQPVQRAKARSVWRTRDKQVQVGEDVRPAGNRFGFRTDQLLMLLAWAGAQERRALESRLAAIEAKLAA